MKKLIFLLIIIGSLSACSNQKDIIKHFYKQHKQNLTVIYTNKPSIVSTITHFKNIQQLQANPNAYVPNSILIVLDTNLKTPAQFKIQQKKSNLLLAAFDISSFSPQHALNLLKKRYPSLSVIYTLNTNDKNIPHSSWKVQKLDLKNIPYLDLLTGKAVILIPKNQIKSLEKTAKYFYKIAIKNYIILASKFSAFENFILKIKQIQNSQFAFKRIYTNNKTLLTNLLQNNNQIKIYQFPNKVDPSFNSVNILIHGTYGISIFFNDLPPQLRSVKLNDLKLYFPDLKFEKFNNTYLIVSPVITNPQPVFYLKKLIKKQKINKIYTNSPVILFHILRDTNISFRWLPRKTISKNSASIIKQIFSLKAVNELPSSIIVYYHFNDSTCINLETIEHFLNNFKIKNLNYLTIFLSKYTTDTGYVNIFKQLIKKYHFPWVYSNKIYTIKALSGLDSLKYIWLPLYNPKIKRYSSLLRFVPKKRIVEQGQAIIVYFIDKSDSLSIQPKLFFKIFNDLKFVKTPNVVFAYSKYLDKTPFTTFLKKMLKDTSYTVYSNKPHIIENLFGYPDDKTLGLPLKCFPPSCELNIRLNYQLLILKNNIILFNDKIVYFKDKADTIHPSEKDLKNNFKYFKFYTFNDGFVITVYKDTTK